MPFPSFKLKLPSKSISLTFFTENTKPFVKYYREPLKADFLKLVSALRETAILCFKNKHKRGLTQSLNFIIRAALLVPNSSIVKSTFKILGSMYVFFGRFKDAILCYDRLRDVADEDGDYENVMFGYQ